MRVVDVSDASKFLWSTPTRKAVDGVESGDDVFCLTFGFFWGHLGGLLRVGGRGAVVCPLLDVSHSHD